MQTTYIGQRAEQVAAEYLERQGYRVLARNWRQRDCEIDIVARKNATVYFVEVKYRSNDNNGGGMDYIGQRKIGRMAYAARRWNYANGWRGPFALSALEVGGTDFTVTAFVESVDS